MAKAKKTSQGMTPLHENHPGGAMKMRGSMVGGMMKPAEMMMGKGMSKGKGKGKGKGKKRGK